MRGFLARTLPLIKQWGVSQPKFYWKRSAISVHSDGLVHGVVPYVNLYRHYDGCEITPITINDRLLVVARSGDKTTLSMGPPGEWPGWVSLYKYNMYQHLVRAFQSACDIDDRYRFHLRLIGWNTAYLHGLCKKTWRKEQILDRSLAILAAQHMAGNTEATPYFLDLLKERSEFYG